VGQSWDAWSDGVAVQAFARLLWVLGFRVVAGASRCAAGSPWRSGLRVDGRCPRRAHQLRRGRRGSARPDRHDAFLLAGGELVRVPVGVRADVDQVEYFAVMLMSTVLVMGTR
jgi:hypothetical protein